MVDQCLEVGQSKPDPVPVAYIETFSTRSQKLTGTFDGSVLTNFVQIRQEDLE